MRAVPARHRALLAGFALLASLIPAPVLGAPSGPSFGRDAPLAAAAAPASKLRGDLAALVAGETTLDPRIAQLVAGYRHGEIPYLVNVTLSGTARDAGGSTVSFALTVRDAAEPGKGHDTIRLQVPQRQYDRSGTVGGGNIMIHR
jgi:hypothetical protein